jgi:hypothetical protein
MFSGDAALSISDADARHILRARSRRLSGLWWSRAWSVGAVEGLWS